MVRAGVIKAGKWKTVGKCVGTTWWSLLARDNNLTTTKKELSRSAFSYLLLILPRLCPSVILLGVHARLQLFGYLFLLEEDVPLQPSGTGTEFQVLSAFGTHYSALRLEMIRHREEHCWQSLILQTLVQDRSSEARELQSCPLIWGISDQCQYLLSLASFSKLFFAQQL